MAAAALLSACGAAHTIVTEPVTAAAAPTAAVTAPALSPGVLFESTGLDGTVRVEERDGLRLLIVDGEVMGGAPVDRVSTPPEGDPLVELVDLANAGKNVVVLGLGTGRTATELAARGARVTVVERSEAVVRAAREQFGFEGQVELADARDWLARHVAEGSMPDVVVLDVLGAPSGHAAREAPILEAALALLRARSRAVEPPAGPLLALRLWDRPKASRVRSLRAALAQVAPFVAFFGAGVADEPQTIYALAGAARHNLVTSRADGAIAAWPLATDDLGPPFRPRSERADDADRCDAAMRVELQVAPERAVVVAGYLVRLEDGTLVLDRPHYEMGAVRYRLRGAAARELERRLGKSAKFPTRGDLRSDGDTSATLVDLLGGGGTKRNETHFSPVAVAVRGKARLVAVVHPDAAGSLPASLRGAEPTHPALPYGGALYDLEVEHVDGGLELAQWREARAAVRAALPIALLERGELVKASGALTPALARLDAALGLFAPWAAERAAMARAASAIAEAALRAGADNAARALACDRARVAAPFDPFDDGQLARALDDALFVCATRHYERAMGPHPTAASAAARRLLTILRARGDVDASSEKRAIALEARLPGIEGLDAPPE